MKLSGIENCIFDVNGVLIDSNAANAQAMAQAFTDDSQLQQSIIELYLKLTGIDRGSKIRRIQEDLIRRPFEEGEFDLRWQRFKKIASVSMLNALPTPGCREVLYELDRRNITRIALSNTPIAELKTCLSVHNLESLLDVIKGGGDWSKSESLIHLLNDRQLNPKRCIFIGDGKGDLAAAKHAGVFFAAIDPGVGEFDSVTGFDGPFTDLSHWGREVLSIEIK